MQDRGDFEMEAPDEEDVRSNTNVMSFQESVGPLSFADDRQAYDILAPPPKYLNDDTLRAFTGPTDLTEILKDFVIDEQGYLVVTNEDIVQRQRGVLGHVVKQVALCMFKGLSISYISLPIKIFVPQSSQVRMVDVWSFAPVFLKRAA